MRKKDLAALMALGFTAAGLPYKTDITKYQIVSKKVKSAVSFLVLSDLHNDCGRDRREKLEAMIRSLHPDFILMPGDMCEENFHQEETLKLMEHLHDIPEFYSTGNHEEYRWDVEPLMERIEDAGVTVLKNTSVVRTFHHTEIEIGGLRCPKHQQEIPRSLSEHLFLSDHYRILLSHRPNWFDLYNSIDCDLVVSGHAHGGQWRIPGTNIAAIAPDQEIFPRYTSGMHDLKNKKLLISRGLVRHYHHIPRLYNNPEIIQVELIPEEKKHAEQITAL